MNAYLQTRLYPSNLSVKTYYLENCNFMPHWHIDVEIILILEGSLKVGVNDDFKILNKGEIAVFKSTDIHYFDSTNMQSKINMIIFRPDIIGSSAGWPENCRFNTPFMDKGIIDGIKTEDYRKLVNTFLSIIQEMNSKEPFFNLCVKGNLIELCALILRYLPANSIDNNKMAKKFPDIDRIKQAIEFIENNYANNISLDTISDEVHFSTCYFSRLFKRFTGTNFGTYLKRVRIEHAELLIKTTSKSITDISFECGFNSVRTFNRTFKKIKGYTPSSLI